MANMVSRALLVASNTITSSSISFFPNPLSLRASSFLNRYFGSGRLVPTRKPNPPAIFHINAANTRLYASSSSEANKINTKVNFSISHSDEDDDDDDDHHHQVGAVELDKSKLPPPYDPFSKKPVVEEPEDPKNLQEIFHKMRTDGLQNSAVKMFDALSKDGRTHEALQLFSIIKEKGHMPDVVAHTAVIEAYVNAGQRKEAHKVYLRMLASGVTPNAYTYTVLIKGLAADPKFVGDAKTHLLEMMGRGLRPNAGTYTAVFEALARESRVEEAREFMRQMEAKGFVANEKDVKEVLNAKRVRGPLFRTLINILFNK
ncbi:pentatricopeptide repeat-containing protein At4g38150-like [Momordica charantia]|uniref:Pentatricopeptide repeat-containing protein At4g38150-like n=1 Tax=Momordica charantia TaxID=3673 RepID=A0A6J1DUN8_MOMCH|nr:pentatricopeptide repeat-containing protein At4g38150-like [Momordica charantia]